MGRLDEAEDQLKRAVIVRTNEGNSFDAAVSIENLAQVYEATGNLEKALNTRLSYDPKNMVCGNSVISQTMVSSSFSLHLDSAQDRPLKRNIFRDVQLARYVALPQVGSRSHYIWAVFYCSQTYQKKDWKTRHKEICSSCK
ncbi:hypothetical protein V8B97DRAFT_603645 [Scleroderma yunnanense]